MISANDARVIALKNPTFERKTQLYKDVSERIEKVSAEGKRSIWLTEEEHYGLNKELTEKGYKHNAGYFINCIGANNHPYHYEF